MLNCYIDKVEDKRVKLIFPRATREEFAKTMHDPLLPLFESIIKSYGSIISSGDLLEHMAAVIFRFRMNNGAAKGNKMSFLPSKEQAWKI